MLTLRTQAPARSAASSLPVTLTARAGLPQGPGTGRSADYGAMTTIAYQVRPATPGDVPAIVGLITSAAGWLREHKHTDQWARPWPDRDSRDARIARGIQHGLTWMLEDQGVLAGTITYRDQGNPKLWTQDELSEPAVYVSRLIVSHGHRGRGIGAALIDWAGQRGIQQWNARWIRVDVWTTNLALHDYYKGQGFTHLRTLEFEDEWEYPSGALFQKPTTQIDVDSANCFTEVTSADR